MTSRTCTAWKTESRTDTQPERGDFALAPFPFTDLTNLKIRPVLVLAAVSHGDVIVAFVTSQPVLASPDVVFVDGQGTDFERSGLQRASAIRLSRLVTVHSTIVQRKIGVAGPALMVQVGAALRAVLEL